MKILVDENVHAGILCGLRAAGHEVVFVPDIGLAGQEDVEILAYAESNGMILLTGDKDFGQIIEFGTLLGRGKVILLRYTVVDISLITSNVLDVLRREHARLSRNNPVVIVLSEGGFRVHC